MEITQNEFIREYLNALDEDYAGIFAGAGLSRSSGYVNWKNLLKEMAEDIHLDINQEDDLVAVAQYYRNERGSRYALNQKILNQFNKHTTTNENLDILSRLPIKHYWTTNYDQLIENTLRKTAKKVDVKISQDSLATTLSERDAVVYKMHGDVQDPSNAVITKDDYEIYDSKRSLFTTALQGDLISKTFLFIGFSFEDPNLNIILSRIRKLLSENQRSHYCIFKRVQKKSFDNVEEYEYAKIKQELKINDMQRYAINVLLVNEYSEITSVLKEIERRFKLKRIFISGSAYEYGKFSSPELFINKLSKQLTKDNYHIVTGFGKGIGDFVASGSLSVIMNEKNMNINKYLTLRPKPAVHDNNIDLQLSYHENIVKSCGIVIFMFGNKLVEDRVIDSPGVLKEFKMAQKNNQYVIPIAATGYASLTIYNYILENINEFPYLKNLHKGLNIADDIDNLIETIFDVIKFIQTQEN